MDDSVAEPEGDEVGVWDADSDGLDDSLGVAEGVGDTVFVGEAVSEGAGSPVSKQPVKVSALTESVAAAASALPRRGARATGADGAMGYCMRGIPP